MNLESTGDDNGWLKAMEHTHLNRAIGTVLHVLVAPLKLKLLVDRGEDNLAAARDIIQEGY